MFWNAGRVCHWCKNYHLLCSQVTYITTVLITRDTQCMAVYGSVCREVAKIVIQSCCSIHGLVLWYAITPNIKMIPSRHLLVVCVWTFHQIQHILSPRIGDTTSNSFWLGYSIQILQCKSNFTWIQTNAVIIISRGGVCQRNKYQFILPFPPSYLGSLPHGREWELLTEEQGLVVGWEIGIFKQATVC